MDSVVVHRSAVQPAGRHGHARLLARTQGTPGLSIFTGLIPMEEQPGSTARGSCITGTLCGARSTVMLLRGKKYI